MGAHSICIKDMAGLLKPYVAYDLVKMIKEQVKIPVQVHTHYTSGLASMTLLKAVEAGVDVIDTAISPMAMGTSQPPTEPMVATLAGTEYDTGLDLLKLDEISKYFDNLRTEYIKSGLLDTGLLKVDVNALLYQVPGGMLSNLVSQLKQAGKSDKLLEVLEEVPRVREEAGYPPLVTPTSQIVGTQAAFNIIMGERYKNVTKEFKGLVKGEYGKTPVQIKPEFIKQIIGDEQPITKRPADDIKPEIDTLREKVKAYYEQEEDILTYALFEQVATKFFDYRKAAKYNIDLDNADMKNKVHPV
jgi:oxaloacetate decarboxylase alpha subunit